MILYNVHADFDLLVQRLDSVITRNRDLKKDKAKTNAWKCISVTIAFIIKFKAASLSAKNLSRARQQKQISDDVFGLRNNTSKLLI